MINVLTDVLMVWVKQLFQKLNPYCAIQKLYTTLLCKVKVIQCLRYVHSCLELVILNKISINNPRQKSVVLESSVKPSLGWYLCSIGLV